MTYRLKDHAVVHSKVQVILYVGVLALVCFFMMGLWTVWLWFCGLELIVADIMVGVLVCAPTEGIKLQLNVNEVLII